MQFEHAFHRTRKRLRHLPPGALQRCVVSVVALVSTALVVLALRGPCHHHLPDNRLPRGSASRGGQFDPEAHKEGIFATSRAGDWLHTPPHHEGHDTITFDVCGSAADQRLSLIYGFIIAKRLNRTAVLPPVITAGVQLYSGDDADPLASHADHVTAPFDEVYDLTLAGDALTDAKVKWMIHGDFQEAADDSIPSRFAVSAAPVIDDVPAFFGGETRGRHISVDCPLYRLAPEIMAAEEEFVFAMLEALRPSHLVQKHVAQAARALGDGPYNYLQLMIERDWLGQCYR
jgi:hypothetical protein